MPPVSSEASALPCGSYEINGTTYFIGPQIPVVPLPTSPLMFYNHATIAHSIYDSTCAAILVEHSRFLSLYTIKGHVPMGTEKFTTNLILSFWDQQAIKAFTNKSGLLWISERVTPSVTYQRSGRYLTAAP